MYINGEVELPFITEGEGSFSINVHFVYAWLLKWADMFSSLINDWIVNFPLKYIN